MIHRFLLVLLCAISLVSCTDEQQRAQAQAKEEKKKEKVFASINNGWKFNTAPTNQTSQSLVATWTAWRDLLNEMSQKPQSSIGAFQKKAKVLSEKVTKLLPTIPYQYNKPEVKARIAVLQTKINSLNLFVNLDDIPAEKVNLIVSDINRELAGFQSQLDEIVRKSKIPKEQGEADMIKMLDTTRAVPTGGIFPQAQQVPSGPTPPKGAMVQREKLP